MVNIVNETLKDFQELINISETDESTPLYSIAENNQKYLRDLKINVANVLKFESLTEKEKYLLALAVSINEKNMKLMQSFGKLARQSGATDAEIAETQSCVSLLQVNNVFYRFRHFTKKEFYEKTPAGIKMSIMMNPVLGKEFFELMSLSVSALNGCEQCVVSHEQSVLGHGGTEQRIYDAIRLSAVVKGLVSII